MSIEQRGPEKWRFTISRDGHTFRKNFIGTEREANKAHEAFKVDVQRGHIGLNENMKFVELSQLVLDEYVRASLKYNTEYMYKCYYNKHILPEFGHRKISSITTLDIQRFANKLSSRYQNRTVMHNLNILKSTFKKGVEWGLLVESPYKNITEPKRKAIAHTELLALDDIKKILDVYTCLKPSVHKVAFYIALGCGLRNSELRALTVDDIDFENNIIRIDKQDGVYYKDNELVTGNIDLKTTSSCRNVYVPTFAMEAIKEYLAVRSIDDKNRQLFCNPTKNKPIDRHTLSKGFKRILEANNLPIIRFHDLRHIHATLLINANVNIQSVSKRLGHSTIQTTLSTYTHSIESVDKEVAHNLEEIVGAISKQSTPELPNLKK